jgi:hypothetical protein
MTYSILGNLRRALPAPPLDGLHDDPFERAWEAPRFTVRRVRTGMCRGPFRAANGPQRQCADAQVAWRSLSA